MDAWEAGRRLLPFASPNPSSPHLCFNTLYFFASFCLTTNYSDTYGENNPHYTPTHNTYMEHFNTSCMTRRCRICLSLWSKPA